MFERQITGVKLPPINTDNGRPMTDPHSPPMKVHLPTFTRDTAGGPLAYGIAPVTPNNLNRLSTQLQSVRPDGYQKTEHDSVNAPRKTKRPAEHFRDIEQRDLHTKRALDLSQKPSSKENPFQLKECRDELKKFITCANGEPWNIPSIYKGTKDSIDIASYQAQKRSHENKHPKIANIFNNIIPSIVRRSACRGHILTVDFAQSHRDILSKIFSLVHCVGWEGIYAFLPWTNMNYTRYSMDITKPMHPSLNFVEAHRRVLKMEEACDELLKYLSTAVEGAHKDLLLMSANNLRDAYKVMVSDGVDKGDGFWSSQGNSSAAEQIAKVFPAAVTAQSYFTESLEWLKSHRKDALTRHFPFLTELDWGVPLLGLLYSIMSPMGKLDDEAEAQTVLTTLMGFIDKRIFVYSKDIVPLLIYGARLTQFTTNLQSLCYNFTHLGNKAGVPFTKAGRFHKLDKDGRLLGSDGGVIQLGLNANIAGFEKWILPFPLEYADLVSEPDLEDLSNTHAQEEMKSVASMLEDLEIHQSAQIITFMKTGHARVKKMLTEDSFQLNLTRILQSSASMPEAEYDPDKVFSIQ